MRHADRVASSVLLHWRLLLLLRLFLLLREVVRLYHRDQYGMSLPQFRQFFAGFDVCLVKWIFALEVLKHFLVAD